MDLATLRALRTPEGRALSAQVEPYDDQRALALGARLRREHPAALVAAAMTQARLRTRAGGKFGAEASRMFFTATGLEQATRASVAQHRARRFAAVGSAVADFGSGSGTGSGAGSGAIRVADLGCGIGSDAIALARAGARVLAVERDPLTAEVARANAEALGLAERIEVRCADVTTLPADALAGCQAAFCDPARRTARGRVFAPESWSPPWSFLLALAGRVPAAAAKVAPGIPHDLAPPGAEVEWVSVGGDVVEAVVWWGPLASGVRRRATLLPRAAPATSATLLTPANPLTPATSGTPATPLTLTDAGLPRAAVRPPGRWLYEPDGAVIRAGLVGHVALAVDGGLLDPTIAYVTSDALVSTTYATAYEVLDVLPFSVKRLRAVLRERAVGRVVVKKRGSPVDPDALRRQLRLSGDGPELTVVLTRVGGAPTVLLARPATPPDSC